jgi:hypothetical protein
MDNNHDTDRLLRGSWKEFHGKYYRFLPTTAKIQASISQKEYEDKRFIADTVGEISAPNVTTY